MNNIFDEDIYNIAHSIRINGESEIKESEFVRIEKKQDKQGFDLFILPGAKCVKVAVPVIINEGGLDETVYNTFHISANTSCSIIAGCVVENNDSQNSSHKGVHEFILEENAVCIYEETHVGYGTNKSKVINTCTSVKLAKNAKLLMDLKQIEGVDSTRRVTSGTLSEGSKFISKEKLLTSGSNKAKSIYDISLEGRNSKCEIKSKAVAIGESVQEFESVISGYEDCYGRVECDTILKDSAVAFSNPRVKAYKNTANLTHEASIGVIAKEQVEKLQTLGITKEEAELQIIEGFLR